MTLAELRDRLDALVIEGVVLQTDSAVEIHTDVPNVAAAS